MHQPSLSRRLPRPWTVWLAALLLALLAPLPPYGQPLHAADDDGLAPPPPVAAADPAAADPAAADLPAERLPPPEDLGEPAPVVTPAATDYIPLCVASVPSADQCLQDLKDFLNHAVPLATAEATARITEQLTHVTKLKAIDATKPLYGLALAPKQVFALKPGNLDADPPTAYTPLWVGCIPVADAQVYLDQLGEEVDEVRADGDYKVVQLPRHWKDSYLRFGHGYVVFADEKIGVDAGLAWLKQRETTAVAALDALTAKPPAAPAKPNQGLVASEKVTARYTIPFRQLMAASGLQDPAQRKDLVRLLAVAWSREAKRLQQRNRGRIAAPAGAGPFTDDPEQLAKTIAALLAVGDEIETAEATLLLDADHAELRWSLQARPDTDLAKAIAAAPTVDPTAIAGIDRVDPILFWTGSYDAMQLRLLKIIAPMYPAPTRKIMDASVKAGETLQGTRYRVVFGFDQAGEFRGAGDYTLNEGLKAADLLAEFATLAKTGVADLSKQMAADPNRALKVDLKLDGPRDEDGWSLLDWAYTVAPDGDDPAINAAVPAVSLNMQTACKDHRVQIGFGTGAERAAADRQSFAAGDAKLAVDPALVKKLAQRAREQHGILVAGFQPYPWIVKALRDFAADAKLAARAKETIGKCSPLTIEAFAGDNRLRGVVSLDAETVKTYAAFMIEVQNAFIGNRELPDDQPPPGGQDEAF